MDINNEETTPGEMHVEGAADQEITTTITTTSTTATTIRKQPQCIAQSTDIAGEDNFPQGCQFSPDGLCVLTSTAADATLRLYNITAGAAAQSSAFDSDHKDEPQDWQSALNSNVVGEVVRSYDWYPQMQSSHPASCIFAATGRDQPVHLIDAYTGGIRATYSPLNALDEMESPTTLKFSPRGDKIVTGGYKTDRMLVLFDASRPGNTGDVIQLGKTKRSNDGQKGLVSALTFTKDSSLIAVGTYAPGSIYIYDYRQKSHSGTIWNDGCRVVGHGKRQGGTTKRKKRRLEPSDDNNNNHQDNILNHNDHHHPNLFSAAKTKWFAQRAQRGITQLEFDSQYMLYSASRHSDAILVWDIRMLSGNPDYQAGPIRGFDGFPTDAHTNQRLQFALDEESSRLWVGGCDGRVLVYDTSTNNSQSGGNKLIQAIDIPQSCCSSGDAVNGVSYNSTYDMLAVATGSRRFPSEKYYDSDDGDSGGEKEEENNNDMSPPGSIQLYKWNSPKSASAEIVSMVGTTTTTPVI